MVDVRLAQNLEMENDNTTIENCSSATMTIGDQSWNCTASKYHHLYNFLSDTFNKTVVSVTGARVIALQNLYAFGDEDAPAMVWLRVTGKRLPSAIKHKNGVL